MRRHPHRTWLTLIALAFLLLIATACGSDATRPASSVVPQPTYSVGKPAQNINDAITQARDSYTSAPPYQLHEVDSVVYVETSVEKARQLIDPSRQLRVGFLLDLPQDSEVWVIVATGEFETFSMSRPFGQRFSGVLVVVPFNARGIYTAPLAAELDLTQLGSVTKVSLPLPEFPTPIMVDSRP